MPVRGILGKPHLLLIFNTFVILLVPYSNEKYIRLSELLRISPGLF